MDRKMEARILTTFSLCVYKAPIFDYSEKSDLQKYFISHFRDAKHPYPTPNHISPVISLCILMFVLPVVFKLFSYMCILHDTLHTFA